jgi:hypothetical protein
MGNLILGKFARDHLQYSTLPYSPLRIFNFELSSVKLQVSLEFFLMALVHSSIFERKIEGLPSVFLCLHPRATLFRAESFCYSTVLL